MEPLFVVAKIIGSPGKNDNLIFHSKLFQFYYDLLSFNYDQVVSVIITIRYSTVTFGNARIT